MWHSKVARWHSVRIAEVARARWWWGGVEWAAEGEYPERDGVVNTASGLGAIGSQCEWERPSTRTHTFPSKGPHMSRPDAPVHPDPAADAALLAMPPTGALAVDPPAQDSTRGWHSPLEWMRWIGRNAKRIAVFVAGVTVLLAGVMMLVLPGPGLLVIILGLAILATEFAWAERALDSAKAKASAAGQKVKRGFKRS